MNKYGQSKMMKLPFSCSDATCPVATHAEIVGFFEACRNMASTIFLILFFVPVAYANLDDSNLSAQESKIVLKTERFSNLLGDFETIWNLVKKVASDQGLKVKEARVFPGEERTRLLSYIDTPDFKLYKNGYILRRRQKQK